MPFAVLNGARLWYDDWPGKHAGPPLFFQHGYHGYRLGYESGSGLAWLLHHRSGHRCIFIEARGCEESRGAPGPHSIGQYAEDCLALLDHLGVGRTYFVGHSMGGAIGYWLGVHHPSRLVGLVLLTPAPSGRPRTAQPPPPPPPRVTLTASYALAQPTEEDEEVELARSRAESYPSITPNSSSEEFIRSRVIRRRSCDPGHYHGAMQSMMQLQLLDRLPEMEVDTLMICGGLDGLLPSNLRDFGQLPKASLCVLPFASHQIAVDEPERCAAEIEAFLRLGAESYRTVAARVIAYYEQRAAKL